MQITDFYFSSYTFTDVHFANFRFSFHELQIFILQITDFHFVSQITVSLLNMNKYNNVFMGDLPSSSRELFKLLKSLQNVLNEPKKKIKIR